MRLGLMTGFGSDWRATLEKIRIAEDLGYELVAVPEAWQLSAIPWLSLIAENTSRIQIGTTIVSVYSRSPAVLAQEYAALELVSGGRMMLGIGVSSQLVGEQMHGVPFHRPLRRLREYTEIFKILIRGERLHYHGEIFTLDRGFSIRYERPRDDVPVWIGAITPKSLVQSGEIADGIMPVHWPTSQMGELRRYLREGAELAGRDDSEITIAPHTPVYLLDGVDDEETMNQARARIENYINRMWNYYHEMLTRIGWADEVRAAQQAWAETRDREQAMAGISDRMIRENEVVGTMPEVRERLRERADNGADLQIIYMPKGAPADAGRVLEGFISA